ncbi:MAG: M15 family metallopeptidase [Marinilabiliaceae bacterium]|nr:M15 family metallopeptidase [Marinilabiliaceae bacterium]
MKTILVSILLCICIFLCSCKSSENRDLRNPYQLDLIQTKAQHQQEVAANANAEMLNLENHIEGIILDIRYATCNNFTGEVIYETPQAFARKPVVEALQQVQDSLGKLNLGLKIYDAYRPYAATLRFYEVYPDTNFVASPRTGSRHNRGCAIDLTLIELSTKVEIPMPTEFDNFTEVAHPDYANLPDNVIANRAFLFSIMKHFGFTHYPTEWWHFDYTGWEAYSLMDIPFSDF